MLHTILVPLDGSAFAEHALPLARGIAVRSRATLILTHVFVPEFAHVADEWMVRGISKVNDAIDAEQRARTLEYLTARSATLAAEGIEVSCTLLDGPVVPTLIEHAESIAADVVVMTTHGHGVFSRAWLGSIADSFVRQSPVPTLLVRPVHEAEAGAANAERALDMRRMLIALDGSPLAEQILPSATALTETMDSELLLLRVVEPLPIMGYTSAEIAARADEFMQPLRDDAHAYLKGVAARLRAQGRRVRTRVAVGRTPAWLILEVARQEACDVIALATHGRGGVVRLLVGSVADKVVRGAEIPVLVFRPR